jgi:hypothetical protein
LPIGVVMSCLYLLVIAALWTGEGAHLAGTEGGDDGGLVPVEDVAALFALLPEGHHRAPLVHDEAPDHLYSHVTASWWGSRRGIENDCTPNTRDAIREDIGRIRREIRGPEHP